MILSNGNLRLPSCHFVLLRPLNQQERREILCCLGYLTLVTKGKLKPCPRCARIDIGNNLWFIFYESASMGKQNKIHTNKHFKKTFSFL